MAKRGYAENEKKDRQEKMNRLAALFGAKTGMRYGVPCTGKWRGTTDYSVVFDNGNRMFITNGMKYFDKELDYKLALYENFIERKDEVMKELRKLEAVDREIANDLSLKSYHLNDIKYLTTGDFVGKIYGVIEVEGEITTIVETGFWRAIESYLTDSPECFNEYLSSASKENYFIAGGLDKADFVFHGVGHDTKSPLYKTADKFVPHKMVVID